MPLLCVYEQWVKETSGTALREYSVFCEAHTQTTHSKMFVFSSFPQKCS